MFLLSHFWHDSALAELWLQAEARDRTGDPREQNSSEGKEVDLGADFPTQAQNIAAVAVGVVRLHDSQGAARMDQLGGPPVWNSWDTHCAVGKALGERHSVPQC